MKLRKMLTKITVLTIIAAAAILPMASFANEVEKDNITGNPFMENVKVDPQTRLLELVANYTPEASAQWESLFQSKETIKSTIDTLNSELKPLIEAYRATNKGAFDAEKEAFIADLRAQVESGEITNEEAATIFKTKKDLRVETKASKVTERENIKSERLAERASNKAERQGLRGLLKLSATEENDAEIITTLNALLTIGLEAESKGYDHIENLETRLIELSAM